MSLYEQIHAFLNNEMTAEERTAFAQRLEREPALKEAFDFESRLVEAYVAAVREKNTRNVIQQVHQNLKQENFFEQQPEFQTEKRTFTMRKFVAIAAAALVVLVLGWVIFFPADQKSPAEIYASYYQPDVQNARTVYNSLDNPGFAGTDPAADSLKQALALYEEGKFEASAGLLQSYLKTHPDDATASYFLALCHLSNSRYAAAIERLQPLSQMENFELRYDAMWYLGLCYLQAENAQDEAKAVFTSLENNPEYPHQKDASAILQMLK